MAQTTLQAPTRPAGRGFYDKNVQAVLWQVVVVGLVAALVGFLVYNTVVNLESRAIKTGYGFLERESGFGIGESPIPFSPANSYGYALIVGFLNTLHVAVIGVVMATLMGVLVGVGSLSRNWLIAKLAAG